MLFKRKGVWYYKFTSKGAVVYKSTKTSDKEEARAIEAKAYSDSLTKIKPSKILSYTWQDAVIRWLSESENKSIETEKYHLIWLQTYLDDMALEDITTDVIIVPIGFLARASRCQNLHLPKSRSAPFLKGIISTA
jgi:hypothetical protein